MPAQRKGAGAAKPPTAPKSPARRRAPQVEEADEEENGGPQFVTVQLGQDTYLYAGKPYTGTVRIQTHDDNGDEIEGAVRKAESLQASVDRWKETERKRMASFQRAGITNPAPAPVHYPMEQGTAFADGDEDEETDEETDEDEDEI